MAILLFVAAVAGRNFTAVGQEGDACRWTARGLSHRPSSDAVVPRPVGGVLIVGHGDGAVAVFFGAILLTAFIGKPSIDAKLAGRQPEVWPAFARAAFILPFGAILSVGNGWSLRRSAGSCQG